MQYSELLRVTNSSNFEVTVDFSAISIDLFPPIKAALLRYGANRIRHLNLNCNMQARHRRALKHRCQNLPHELESSIALQLPYFEAEVAALVSRILFKTKRLHSLSLKSINLDFCDLDVICQGLISCSTLRSLAFVSVPIGDEGFQMLAAALRRPGVTDLTCRACGLTDDSSAELRQLVKFHMIVQRKEDNTANKEKRTPELIALASIDLRGNALTPYFVEDVRNLVDRSPVYRFDLRDNAEITRAMKRISPKFIVGVTPKRGKVSDDERLKLENERLKGKVGRIIGRKNVAAVNDKVFIVGHRAPELADHIFALDRLCTKLEKQGVMS